MSQVNIFLAAIIAWFSLDVYLSNTYPVGYYEYCNILSLFFLVSNYFVNNKYIKVPTYVLASYYASKVAYNTLLTEGIVVVVRSISISGFTFLLAKNYDNFLLIKSTYEQVAPIINMASNMFAPQPAENIRGPKVKTPIVKEQKKIVVKEDSSSSEDEEAVSRIMDALPGLLEAVNPHNKEDMNEVVNTVSDLADNFTKLLDNDIEDDLNAVEDEQERIIKDLQTSD